MRLKYVRDENSITEIVYVVIKQGTVGIVDLSGHRISTFGHDISIQCQLLTKVIYVSDWLLRTNMEWSVLFHFFRRFFFCKWLHFWSFSVNNLSLIIACRGWLFTVENRLVIFDKYFLDSLIFTKNDKKVNDFLWPCYSILSL